MKRFFIAFVVCAAFAPTLALADTPQLIPKVLDPMYTNGGTLDQIFRTMDYQDAHQGALPPSSDNTQVNSGDNTRAISGDNTQVISGDNTRAEPEPKTEPITPPDDPKEDTDDE